MSKQIEAIISENKILDKLPEDQRKKLLPKIKKLLEKRIVITLTLLLPNENKDELEKKLENNDPDIAEFLQEKVPNCKKKLQEIIDKFKFEIEQML